MRFALLLLGALLAVFPARAASAEEPLPVEEVAPGLFVHVGELAEATPENAGDIANIGFVVGNDAVAVIDTGGSALVGTRLHAAIRQVTQLPIRFVINTHMHPDHVLGNQAFVADAPVFIAHSRLPASLAARADYFLDRLRLAIGGEAAEGTTVVMPSRLVAAEEEIDLGGRKLRLKAWPTAHSDNDLTVYDERTETLWAADLLFVGRVPAIDGSLKGWLAACAALREIPAERVVPGHGPAAAPWPAALDAQERYLTLLQTEIRAALKAHRRIEQAVTAVGLSERENWALFDEYNPRNVTTSFAELEWE